MRAEVQRPPLASMPAEYLAACAELAGLTVLHLDKDFDLIADITGQPMEPRTWGQPLKWARMQSGPRRHICLNEQWRR
jgi:hypothetical protein